MKVSGSSSVIFAISMVVVLPAVGQSVPPLTTSLMALPSVRKLQVIGLASAVIKPPADQTAKPGSRPPPASADVFCLIDTGGGAVRLRVLSPNSTKAGELVAISASGSVTRYDLQLESTTLGIKAVFNVAENAYDLPAGAAATSLAACGAGNVRKIVTILSQDGAPSTGKLSFNGKVYVDTLTFIATPL